MHPRKKNTCDECPSPPCCDDPMALQRKMEAYQELWSDDCCRESRAHAPCFVWKSPTMDVASHCSEFPGTNCRCVLIDKVPTWMYVIQFSEKFNQVLDFIRACAPNRPRQFDDHAAIVLSVKGLAYALTYSFRQLVGNHSVFFIVVIEDDLLQVWQILVQDGLSLLFVSYCFSWSSTWSSSLDFSCPAILPWTSYMCTSSSSSWHRSSMVPMGLIVLDQQQRHAVVHDTFLVLANAFNALCAKWPPSRASAKHNG